MMQGKYEEEVKKNKELKARLEMPVMGAKRHSLPEITQEQHKDEPPIDNFFPPNQLKIGMVPKIRQRYYI